MDLSIVNILLFPVHGFVPCQASGILAGCSMWLTIGIGLLLVLSPSGQPSRMRPLALGLIGFLLNLASTH